MSRRAERMTGRLRRRGAAGMDLIAGLNIATTVKGPWMASKESGRCRSLELRDRVDHRHTHI